MYNPQLNTFICVAEEGSFGKAAEKLYISTPAVAKQITLLEESLGLQLCNRTRKGVTLTDAGRSYYWDAKNMIKLSKDAIVRARRAETQKRVVRVGVSLLTSQELLNMLIPQVQMAHPEMQFKMVPFGNEEGEMKNFYSSLGQDIDVALLMCNTSRETGAKTLPLCYEPIGCAVSIMHPLASKRKLTPQDLYNHNYYIMPRGFNPDLDRLRDYIEKKHPLIHLVDLDHFNLNSFNRIEASRNMMFGIERWNGMHPLVKVIPVDWNFRIPLGLVYSENPSDIVQQFIDTASHVFRSTKRKTN